MAVGFADLDQTMRDLAAIDKPMLFGKHWLKNKALGSITAISDAGGGNLSVTSAAHGLTTDHTTKVDGTDDYDGTFPVLSITSVNIFVIEGTYTSSQTGTWTANVRPQWRQSGSWAAGSDETDALGPATRTYDGLTDLRTYPDSAQTDWYLIIDLGPAAPGVLDGAFIMTPKKFSGQTIDLQVADDNAYTTNLRTIATVTPSDNDRVVWLDLDHTSTVQQRYTDVRYIRLYIHHAATTFVPEIGELFLSFRRQLKHHPMLPYPERQWESRINETETHGGSTTLYSYYYGRRKVPMTLNPYETAYINDLEEFYLSDTVGLSGPFFWIPRPTDYPDDALFMVPITRLYGGNLVNFTEEQFTLVIKEQGPHYLELEG